jgi:peptide/nickel transport system substrate-binding protein
MSKDRHVSSILTGLWFAVLILCGMAVAPVATMAEPRGEIRVVESWRPDINVLGHNVLQYLYEYALDRNELVPCLAISRKWVDDTTLELKLREGVSFHNGEAFDAYAVKFNFEYQRKNNPERGVQVYLKNLKEIHIVDRYTLRMILFEPDALFLDKIIIGPISGWVIGAPEYMGRVGWDRFMKHPVGTGPYMVQGMVKDHENTGEGEVYAQLVANPHYWNKGYPKIRKINFVRYSPKEALEALVADRLDLVTCLIPKDTLKVEESPYSKVVKGRQDVTYMSGAFNLMSSHTLPLWDIRVRKALNFAVNKHELMRYAYKGNAVEMKGVLCEKSGVDLSSAKTYEWSIPKARELLRDAGYEDGFRMKLFYEQENYLIARLLKRFYSLLEIEVEITPIDWEWEVEHWVYANTRDGYSWEDEDWWLVISSNPSYVPEFLGGLLEYMFNSTAPFRAFPRFLMLPLDRV